MDPKEKKKEDELRQPLLIASGSVPVILNQDLSNVCLESVTLEPANVLSTLPTGKPDDPPKVSPEAGDDNSSEDENDMPDSLFDDVYETTPSDEGEYNTDAPSSLSLCFLPEEDPQETRGPHQQESLDPSSGIAVPGGARLKKEDNEPEGSSTKFVEPKKSEPRPVLGLPEGARVLEDDSGSKGFATKKLTEDLEVKSEGGNYDFELRLLGEGSQGVCYVATQLAVCLDRQPVKFAVKKVPKDNFRSSEVDLMAILKDHPGIVHLLGYIPKAEQRWILMEYINGITLKDFLEDNTLSLEQMLPLIDAVKHLHANGIVHNDINEDNIMVRSVTNELVVIDLGHAGEYTDNNRDVELAIGVMLRCLNLTKASDSGWLVCCLMRKYYRGIITASKLLQDPVLESWGIITVDPVPEELATSDRETRAIERQ